MSLQDIFINFQKRHLNGKKFPTDCCSKSIKTKLKLKFWCKFLYVNAEKSHACLVWRLFEHLVGVINLIHAIDTNNRCSCATIFQNAIQHVILPSLIIDALFIGHARKWYTSIKRYLKVFYNKHQFHYTSNDNSPKHLASSNAINRLMLSSKETLHGE